jgi:SAM-dependent methyltransferase
MATFTFHNIRLDDGTLTNPELGFLISEAPWFQAARRAIEISFPGGVAGKRIVDLGCLEGGYTVEFARMGMEALGIEIRQSNFEACEFVKSRLRLPNLRFVKDDVWNVTKYGEFDAIFCCGLLYHLVKPLEFLKILSQICRRTIVVNTHIATETKNQNFPLGEITESEGAAGRWLHEYDQASPNLDLEQFRWTSWSNAKSFWPMKEHIIDTLHQSGFTMIFEKFDFTGDSIAHEMRSGYYATHDRRMFVGIKCP